MHVAQAIRRLHSPNEQQKETPISALKISVRTADLCEVMHQQPFLTFRIQIKKCSKYTFPCGLCVLHEDGSPMITIDNRVCVSMSFVPAFSPSVAEERHGSPWQPATDLAAVQAHPPDRLTQAV